MKKWLLGCIALLIALLFPQKAYALTDDTSLPVSDTSQFMSYYTGAESNYAFNIRGMYNGESIQTTFSNAGYFVVVEVDGARREFREITNGKVFQYNGVDFRLRLTPTTDGRAIQIFYDMENRSNKPKTVKIGSSADTQIGQNDHATVVFNADGIEMSDENERYHTYGAKFSLYHDGSTPFTTKWLGVYSSALNNVFTDGVAQGLSSFDGDSGIAWSWTVNLDAAGGPDAAKTVGTQVKLDSVIEIGNTAFSIIPEDDPQYFAFTVPFTYQRNKSLQLFYKFDDEEDFTALASVCETNENEGGVFETVTVNAADVPFSWQPDSDHKLYLYVQDVTGGTGTMKSKIMEYDIYWPHGVKFYASVLVNKDGKAWEGMAEQIRLLEVVDEGHGIVPGEYDNNGTEKVPAGTYRIFLNGEDTGETLEITDQNVVKVLDYYTVTFEPNDYAGTLPTVSVLLKNRPIDFPVYTRGCHVFRGWNTAADGSGEVIDPAAAIVTDTLTVYAQWEENHQFALTCDPEREEDGHWLECSVCHLKKESEAHAYTLTNDADSHWQECNVCHYKKEIVHHAFEILQDADGHWEKCSVCAYEKEKLKHTFELTQDADCHWQECGVCHRIASREAHAFALEHDADTHWQECSVCHEIASKEAHAFALEHDVDTHWRECSVCHEIASKEDHAFQLTNDEFSHWQECSVCHETASKEDHAFALATDADGHWQECGICHETKKYGAHEFKFEFNDTEHWQQCEECEWKKDTAAHDLKQQFDETEHWMVCTDENCSFETEKLHHTFSDWHVVIDATIEHEGKDGCECSECGYEKTRKVPMIYVILEGANGEWKRGTADAGLRFVANGKLENFSGILIDGRDINPRLYKSKAGSTIIELSPELLEGLKLGTHKLEVTYVDGSCGTLFKTLKEDIPKAPVTNDSLTNLYVDLCTIFLFAGIVVFLIFVIKNERKRGD